MSLITFTVTFVVTLHTQCLFNQAIYTILYS